MLPLQKHRHIDGLMQDAAILPSEVGSHKRQKNACSASAGRQKTDREELKHSFQTARLTMSCSYVKQAAGDLPRGRSPAAENDQRKHAVIAAC